MSKGYWAVAVLALLVSCASIPSPESPDDSLVIGYFALDFPDGYFEQGRRTITSGINLYFVNQRTGDNFWVMTTGGYYKFLSNGSDSYKFASFKIESDRGTIESPIDRTFSTRPHSVIYLGHLTFVYAKPMSTHKTSADSKVIYWNYETSVNFVWNEGQLKTYLRDKDPKSPWLEYESVRGEMR